jgi:hypothetical protein
MNILAMLPEAERARACLDDAALAAAMVDPKCGIEAFHVRGDPDHLVRAPEGRDPSRRFLPLPRRVASRSDGAPRLQQALPG